jgi:hypothetical protein
VELLLTLLGLELALLPICFIYVPVESFDYSAGVRSSSIHIESPINLRSGVCVAEGAGGPV